MVRPSTHPGPSLSSLTCMPRPFPDRVKDKDAGLFALDGQPKTVEEAVDRMQFSRQERPPKPTPEVVRAVGPEEAPQGAGDGR